MWKNLLNNIIKTVTTSSPVSYLQQQFAPKPQSSSPSGLTMNYNPNNLTTRQITSGLENGQIGSGVSIERAIKSGGLTPSYQPTTNYNTGGGGSSGSGSSPSGSVFRNSFTSLIPKAYATSGQDVISSMGTSINPSSNTTWQNLTSALNPFANITKGINTISNKIYQDALEGKATEGSWFSLPDYGYTERGTDYLSKLAGYATPTSAVTPNTSIRGTDPALINRLTDTANKNIGSFNTGVTGSGAYNKSVAGDLSSQLTAIDAETNAILDSINAQMMNGEIPEEEGIRLANEAQQAAQDKIYDEMIRQQEAEVPLLNNEFDVANKSLTASTEQAKQEGKSTKSQNTNVYGEAIRKMVGNRDIAQKNINNVYTAAGTAGGSDYLQAMSGTERDTGNNVAASERDLASKNSEIDRQKNAFELQVKDKVNQLVLEKQRQLKTINDNINMSRTQKTAATLELNSQLAKDLQAVRQSRIDQNNAFLGMKQQLALNSNDLIKRATIDDSLYNRISSPALLNAGTNPNATQDSRNVANKVRKNIKGELEVWDSTYGTWIPVSQSRQMYS